MTNPSRKRVPTLDDLNVLNQNAAYARQKGEAADAAATRATTAADQAEQAASALPSLTEAATLLGDAREAAGYVVPLAAAKQQADQDHTRATQDRQQVTESLAGIGQTNAAMQRANQIALSAAIADIRAAETGLIPTLARPPQVDTYAAPQGWASGPAAQRGYTQQAGTGTVNALLGALTVDANVVGGAGAGLVTPYRVWEGIYRVEVRSGTPAIMWGGDGTATGWTYAVWRGGGGLEIGWWNIKSWGNVEDISSITALAVPAEPYCVEVLLTIRAFVVRVWPLSGSRADAQVAVVQINNDAPPALPGGPLRLASLGGPATYGAVQVDTYDRAPNPIAQRAALVGPWFGVVEAQLNCAATYTSGAELRCTISGTPGLAINSVIPEGMSLPPVLAVRTRQPGGAWSAWTRHAVPGGSPGDVVRTDVLTGLTPALTYDVQVAANIHEDDPHWTRRCGLIVQDVFVAPGGRVAATVEARRVGVMGVGDSITAAIVALGYDTGPVSTPSKTTSEWSYLHVACDLLGAVPIHSGYGGTGVTVSGSGGMPPAPVNTMSTMLNRPGRAVFPTPDIILINLGQNDDGANNRTPPARPTEATFISEYRRLIFGLTSRYPAAQIICMRPFNGGFWPQIQAVAQSLGLATIDTTGWLSVAAGDYSDDPVHPRGVPEGQDKGHRKAGRLLAAALQERGIPVRTP